MTLLLDTCAALHLTNGERLARAARNEIEATLNKGSPLFVSPITAWEVGQLVAKRRFNLPEPPLKWFQYFLSAPGVALAAMDVEILIAASFLPDFDNRDPADRIIVATAREHGYRIVTRDRRILAYAERGFCRALAC